jgi:hypothetical protein
VDQPRIRRPDRGRLRTAPGGVHQQRDLPLRSGDFGSPWRAKLAPRTPETRP